MSKDLEALPGKVRFQAVRMRALMKIIESAPLSEVAEAIPKLKKEIEILLDAANEAEERRPL